MQIDIVVKIPCEFIFMNYFHENYLIMMYAK